MKYLNIKDEQGIELKEIDSDDHKEDKKEGNFQSPSLSKCIFFFFFFLFIILLIFNFLLIFLFVMLKFEINEIKYNVSEIRNLKEEIKILKGEINKETNFQVIKDELNDKLNKEMNNLKKEIDNKMNNGIKEMNNEVKEMNYTINNEIENKMNNLTNEINTKIDNAIKDIKNNLTEEINNETNNLINETDKEINKEKGEIREVKNEITTYTDDNSIKINIKVDKMFFKRGMIIAWFGEKDKIPENWTICDGTNGSPDLRNRFIIGSSDTINFGETGGNSHIRLDKSNLPPIGEAYFSSDSHNGKYHHTSNDFIEYDSCYSVSVRNGATDDWGTNYKIDLKSGMKSSPFNIMNPYFSLYYIMKL